MTREALELDLSAASGLGGFGDQIRRHAWRDSVRFTAMGPDMTTPVPCVAARHRTRPMGCLRPEDIAETVIFVVRLTDLISLDSLQVLSPAQVACLDQQIYNPRPAHSIPFHASCRSPGARATPHDALVEQDKRVTAGSADS